MTDGKNYGTCSQPMDAQEAIHELCVFLLGENYYTINPKDPQATMEIVSDIKSLYEKSWIRKGLVKK